MSENIRLRIKKVLVENLLKDMEVDELGNDAPLIEYGVGVDSVSRLEFLVALEEEFRVKLDESEITAAFFETVDSIADHLSKRLDPE
jgi:acyl carrier protein